MCVYEVSALGWIEMEGMRKQATLAGVIGAGLVYAMAASADPYDPGERALGGGLLRTGTGAVTGPIAGGGHGAGMGAAVGGGLGAATTPTPPPRTPYRHHYRHVHHSYYRNY